MGTRGVVVGGISTSEVDKSDLLAIHFENTILCRHSGLELSVSLVLTVDVIALEEAECQNSLIHMIILVFLTEHEKDGIVGVARSEGGLPHLLLLIIVFNSFIQTCC